MNVIGRRAERETLRVALESGKPELIALWGRRRVGKTFLVRYGREPVRDWYFELTGQRNGDRETQLGHFSVALSKAFHNGVTLAPPRSWEEAFKELEASISSLPEDGKPVTVFFDEAPWLDSRRSGFLDALEYFWNSTGSTIPRLKMFICGSAASWIVQKIVNGKGGWHRRITGRIRVPQFKLHEVSSYLTQQHIRLSQLDILRLYMVLGGVPYYLSLMRKGDSVTTFVDRLFFASAPALENEFDELFDSLFTHSEVHKRIVSQVARTKSGLTRTEISSGTKLASGGKLTQYIQNLEQSGFLETHLCLGETGERYRRYRICDMFTLFHLQWLKGKAVARSWQAIVNSQRYKSWCGHAFEILAWNHADALAQAIGISRSDYTVTRGELDNSTGRAQIDLLFDVSGGAVYLLELKFCEGSYVMTAAEATKLVQRRNVLSAYYKGRRSIVVCLLAPEGVQKNAHLDTAVDMVLDGNSLFRSGA